MTAVKPISSAGFFYNRIIGTGGIGSGIFFSLKENETLGREESRMATLLPYKDYCKQHIIMHYVAVLLGAKINGAFQSFPIGRVGNDDTGKSLVEQMQRVGMNTKYIKASAKLPTLFSVCYLYPDHAGGNITTAESASSEVSVTDIEEFFEETTSDGTKDIILAAPEVPVNARIKLLELGRKRGSLTVASVVSSEIQEFKEKGGFAATDILSVNIDEAKHIGGIDATATHDDIVHNAIHAIVKENPLNTLLVTCGSSGVYCYSNHRLQFFPALKVPVVSTAGAGDAFIAGCIAGICCGLPFMKETKVKELSTSTELGILLAALSVTSADTIHTGVDGKMLYDFLQENKLSCSPEFLQMFI